MIKAIKNIDVWLLLLSLVGGAASLIYNHFTYRYPFTMTPHSIWLIILVSFIFLVIFIFSLKIKNKMPISSLFLKTLSRFYFIVLLLILAGLAVQVTPFSAQNKMLLQADQWMHFDVLTIMNWAYSYRWLISFLWTIYLLLFPIVFITPLCLALFREEKQINIYFAAFILSLLIGYVIYYFFPTSSPAAVLKSSEFIPCQYRVVAQFQAMHHYRHVLSPCSGLIAFPSFHTVWAVLVAYAFKNKKILFYPVLIFSSLLIFSTLATGWHFLIDVIAGIVLAVISIWVARLFYKRD